MKISGENADFAGALTLLRDCVQGSSGERLLIVSEMENSGFYDDQAPRLTATAGRQLGMVVFETKMQSFCESEDEKDVLLNSLTGFDHVVFFSRVGDQFRFGNREELRSSTMCYTLNCEALNSSFGTACYHGMSEVKQAIDNAFNAASQIRVTCPRGTDYLGRFQSDLDEPVEVSLKRFPLLVPSPVPAEGFRGRIALSRFLIGTGSKYYDPYFLVLPKDVIACVEGNRISHFEGEPADVQNVEKHYQHVSQQLSIDPWCVHSWHAGIHPACHFKSDAESNILRWSGSAFGNPRLLHFHTCGNYAPGEISWNILDPTIYLDDVPVWDAGQLHPDRLPGGDAIMARHPNLAMLFANPVRDIGLSA